MELEIKLLRSEIMYDVMNETHIAGKCRFNGENDEFVYNMQAAEDDLHVNKLLRSMEANLEELKTQLSYFLKNEARVQEDDDVMGISLEVTGRFNKAYMETVSLLFHKFIVNKMIFEWYNTTKPDEAKVFLELAGENLNRIKASFFRMPPVRRKTEGN